MLALETTNEDLAHNIDLAHSDDAANTDEILAVVTKAVRRCLDTDGNITPAVEAQVHRAVDLLRLEGAPGETLRVVEGISCRLQQMRASLRDGRVNAYASNLLRLERAVALR